MKTRCMSCGSTTTKMKKGGRLTIKKVIKKPKMQNGGITKDGKTFKLPPIPKKEIVQKSVQPTRQTAFEKRQNKKKTKFQIKKLQ
jgi:hypothetical protein